MKKRSRVALTAEEASEGLGKELTERISSLLADGELTKEEYISFVRWLIRIDSTELNAILFLQEKMLDSNVQALTDALLEKESIFDYEWHLNYFTRHMLLRVLPKHVREPLSAQFRTREAEHFKHDAAIRRAEQEEQEKYEAEVSFCKRRQFGHLWDKQPASEEQRDYLETFYDIKLPANATKRQASDMIVEVKGLDLKAAEQRVRTEPASDAQKQYVRSLGGRLRRGATKLEASDTIHNLLHPDMPIEEDNEAGCMCCSIFVVILVICVMAYLAYAYFFR